MGSFRLFVQCYHLSMQTAIASLDLAFTLSYFRAHTQNASLCSYTQV